MWGLISGEGLTLSLFKMITFEAQVHRTTSIGTDIVEMSPLSLSHKTFAVAIVKDTSESIRSSVN